MSQPWILLVLADMLLVVGIAVLGCLLIVLLAHLNPKLAGRAEDLEAKQKSHLRATPRTAGLGLFAAVGVGVLLVPDAVTETYNQFLIAAFLLFAVGLLEDLGIAMAPKWRLLAAAISSLICIFLMDAWLPRAGIPFLNSIIDHWAVGVPLTILVTVGVANGFNLIDGVNGLAALAGFAAAIGLSYIASKANYHEVQYLGLMLAAAIVGFAILNYPFGLIFLGDAGAYTLGFLLSWLGIAVLLNVPEATAWSLILLMFWPLADTLLAIHRRRLRDADTLAPDRLHMHQLVMRGLELCCLGTDKRLLANSLTTVILAPFVMTPVIFGVLFWNQPTAAFLAVIVFLFLFFGTYRLGFVVVRRLRLRRPTLDRQGQAVYA